MDNSVPDFVPLLPSNLLTSHDFVVWWSGRVLSVPECFRGCVGALGARAGSRDSIHAVGDTDLDHSGPIWDLMDRTAEHPRYCDRHGAQHVLKTPPKVGPAPRVILVILHSKVFFNKMFGI